MAGVESELDWQRINTIVVVDDDSGMRMSLQFLLESYGFKVMAFDSPDALFASLDTLVADCAIIDIHLPGVEGTAVYATLSQRLPGLPVIFITGQIDDQIRAAASEANAVAVLEKPFSDESLLTAVRDGVGGGER